jgi:radical SAM superfamily enzyme YgiQ (UPF0313 family)
MRCVLVIPSWKPEDLFPPQTAGSQVNYWEPLGTLYVGSALEKAGHEVKLLNGAFLSHEEIVSAVEAWRPGFTGIYSTTFGWPKALRTVEDVKRVLPGTFTAVGGPYPMAAQEKCLADSGSLDAVVKGEGEKTVVEMLERIERGESLEGVAGVDFREDGRIFRNRTRALMTDLDALPQPARHLLGSPGSYLPPPATYRRKPVAVMITSRGCSRRCIFCFQQDRERRLGVRCRSVDSVLDEIEDCLRLGYREVKFLDDTLASDYDRALALAEGITRRRLDFTWFASACVNQVDERLLRAFRKAGCWAVLLGAESGVQKNLNALRKGITPGQTVMAVKAARRAGLSVHTPFIIGIPGETVAEARRTIDFACELDPDIASFHALTPFPGTELYDEIEKYGTLSRNLSDYTYQGAAFVPHTMSREDILGLRQEAYRRFYSRPKFLARRLAGVRSFQDIEAAAKGLRSLCGLWSKKRIFGREAQAQP